MSGTLAVYLACAALAVAVALYSGGAQVRCACCGRRCGGRIAGGTLDAPECVRCVVAAEGQEHAPASTGLEKP